MDPGGLLRFPSVPSLCLILKNFKFSLFFVRHASELLFFKRKNKTKQNICSELSTVYMQAQSNTHS